jgi:hypothetical protein
LRVQGDGINRRDVVEKLSVQLFLGDRLLGVALSNVNEVVPVAVDVAGRSTLHGDGLSHECRINHVNRVPGANLSAVLASDAAIQVDITPALKARMIFSWNFIDTFDGADLDTGLAARATVGVNNREDLGDDLARFAGE